MTNYIPNRLGAKEPYHHQPTWVLKPAHMCHVQNMVTRGLEAPDEINIFSSSVQWFLQPSQCFVNIDRWKMATKCHEDGVQNTLSMVFAGVLRPSFSDLFFWEELFLSSIFQFRGQQLEQVLVDIVLSPYILICLAEQLWVGQAIDACLHTATNEAFAPCPQLINLLRSSNSTLFSLLLSSHFASELRATAFDLFNSWGNISTHVPRKIHSVSAHMSLPEHEP